VSESGSVTLFIKNATTIAPNAMSTALSDGRAITFRVSNQRLKKLTKIARYMRKPMIPTLKSTYRYPLCEVCLLPP